MVQNDKISLGDLALPGEKRGFELSKGGVRLSIPFQYSIQL